MSPEDTHNFMGFNMEVYILGVILQYMVSASLSCFVGCIGLRFHWPILYVCILASRRYGLSFRWPAV